MALLNRKMGESFQFKSDILRHVTDPLCFAAMCMLETFDDPDSSVVDIDKVFTTAVVTHKFYSSFILELQPSFDKEFEENAYRKYVRTQINCYLIILQQLGQTGLHQKLEHLVGDESNEQEEDSSVKEYMEHVSKKQRKG